ncbi:hypothetical protein LOD99_3777 [Oopsacas minuta]|uniref:Phosphatidylinositol-3,4,5-trisphosphate 3-phosphatase n=1 Tax=Oopsacas minuta TaxID=111878 RepID=A0AAV7JWB9_9METZ|nr:hypothetical protein LOD99_3777 [Oopsacas minuta]
MAQIENCEISCIVEGFICPECHLQFSNPDPLQEHYMAEHVLPTSPIQSPIKIAKSDEFIDDAQVTNIDLNYNPSEMVDFAVLDETNGHMIEAANLHRAGMCCVCHSIIFSVCYICMTCNKACHPKCLTNIGNCELFVSMTEDMRLYEGRDYSLREKREKIGISGIIKRVLSKKTERYTEEGFDLDLTYITERIIAMSFPATGVESVYRNGLRDVAKMLMNKHGENYLVFNLSERRYDISKLNNQVLDFGWPDHLAPSLDRLCSICKSITSWLDSDQRHVAVVHCVGGKGRTGVVVAAYLHYSNICNTPESALDKFAMQRFFNEKHGVNQPSQRRYVYYFADLLAGQLIAHNHPAVITRISLQGIPNCDNKGGCKLFFKFYQNLKPLYTTPVYEANHSLEQLVVPLSPGLILIGDILIKCYNKRNVPGKRDCIFRVQFPSYVIETEQLLFIKSELDDAWKDKRFPDEGHVELTFSHQGDNSIPTNISPITTLTEENSFKSDTYCKFRPNYNAVVPDKGDMRRYSDLTDDELISVYSAVDYNKKSLPVLIEIPARTRNETETTFGTPPEVIPYRGDDLPAQKAEKIDTHNDARNSVAFINKTVKEYKSRMGKKKVEKKDRIPSTLSSIDGEDAVLPDGSQKDVPINFDDIIICKIPDKERCGTLTDTTLEGIDLEGIQKYLEIDQRDWDRRSRKVKNKDAIVYKDNDYKNDEETLKLLRKYEEKQSKLVSETIEDWYKASITREAAVRELIPLPVGSFVIRDSQTVSGGYALSMKVPDSFVLQKSQDTGESLPTNPEDCVRHFLIAPHHRGIRLQGWEEPPFDNLTTFVIQHSNQPMALPCRLRIRSAHPVAPTEPVPRPRGELKNIEIAAKAVYLGGLNIAGKGTKVQMEDVAAKLSTARKSLSILVEIKVSAKEGITITDVNKKAFDSRSFMPNEVTFAAVCTSVKWTGGVQLKESGIEEQFTNSNCFGLVVGIRNQVGHTCLTFADPSPSNISQTIVCYINTHLI